MKSNSHTLSLISKLMHKGQIVIVWLSWGKIKYSYGNHSDPHLSTKKNEETYYVPISIPMPKYV